MKTYAYFENNPILMTRLERIVQKNQSEKPSIKLTVNHLMSALVLYFSALKVYKEVMLQSPVIYASGFDKTKFQDITSLPMPSAMVDDFWHECILNTKFYQEFCEKEFGQFIHHNPDVDGVHQWQDYMIKKHKTLNKTERLPLHILFMLTQKLSNKPVNKTEILQDKENNINHLFMLVEPTSLTDLIINDVDEMNDFVTQTTEKTGFWKKLFFGEPKKPSNPFSIIDEQSAYLFHSNRLNNILKEINQTTEDENDEYEVVEINQNVDEKPHVFKNINHDEHNNKKVDVKTNDKSHDDDETERRQNNIGVGLMTAGVGAGITALIHEQENRYKSTDSSGCSDEIVAISNVSADSTSSTSCGSSSSSSSDGGSSSSSSSSSSDGGASSGCSGCGGD